MIIRRFQFSLGRLIVSVTLLCVAIGFWRQSFAYGNDSSFASLNPFALSGFAMALAASVGVLFNRALVFAFAAYLGVLGLALAFLSWFVMWLWF